MASMNEVVWEKNEGLPAATVINNNSAKAKEAEEQDTSVQKISTRQIVCLLAIILVFLLSTAGTVILWETNIIEETIDERLILKNGSDSYYKWIKPPVHSLPSFWLFNYTNVRAFELGEDEKLKVEEVGPFVFRERLQRVNVVFHDNGTVTYQNRKLYEFLPERSGASLNDNVVSINIPLMAMHRQADMELNFFQRLGASAALKMMGAEPFITKTAMEWFFGYKDTLITLAEFKVPDVKTGIVQEKNGTSPDRITIYTGESDVNVMGQITHFNGHEFMDYYYGDQCNRVDGSDGSKFPPSKIFLGSTIYIYERDACRRIPFIANESTTAVNDWPVIRFYTPDNVFHNAEDNPDNECYCKDECQLSGLADISHCKRGAPLFVSLPHFYKSDPRLLEAVEGLNPDPEKHQLYLDIHPRIGAPLSMKIRIQLNVLFSDGLMQPTTNKLKGLVLPFTWMERSLDEYPDDVRAIIDMITFTVPAVTSALSYIFPLLVAITSIVLFIIAYIEVAALLRKDPPSRAPSETLVTRL